MKKNLKRRDFIKKAGIAGAAATAVSSFPAPAIAADRVEIAIVLQHGVEDIQVWNRSSEAVSHRISTFE